MDAAKQSTPAGGIQLVEALMQSAFDRQRDPRSDAYKLGARELLNCKVRGTPFRCPFKLGTAEADAFFAGSDEGNFIWRQHQQAVGEAAETSKPEAQ